MTACVATPHETLLVGGGVHLQMVRLLPAEPAGPLHGGGGQELGHGGDEGVRSVRVAHVVLPGHRLEVLRAAS